MHSMCNMPSEEISLRQLSVLRKSERNLARANALAACEQEERLRSERTRVERAIYEEEYEVLALSMDDVEVEQFMSWLPQARRAVSEARRLEGRARIDMLYALTALETASAAVEEADVARQVTPSRLPQSV